MGPPVQFGKYEKREHGSLRRAVEHLYIDKKKKAYLYIFYTAFTGYAIEVCIKNLYIFLRKVLLKSSQT